MPEVSFLSAYISLDIKLTQNPEVQVSVFVKFNTPKHYKKSADGFTV
jgi:hypothetical protein